MTWLDPARLWAMARKETLQLRRDRRSLLLAFALPLLLLVIFGYAIVWDVRDIALAVVDQDRSRESRELVDGFVSSGYFHLAARPERASDAVTLFARGTARLVLVVPPGFAADIGGEHHVAGARQGPNRRCRPPVPSARPARPREIARR